MGLLANFTGVTNPQARYSLLCSREQRVLRYRPRGRASFFKASCRTLGLRRHPDRSAFPQNIPAGSRSRASLQNDGQTMTLLLRNPLGCLSYAASGGVSRAAKGDDCKSNRFSCNFNEHSEKFLKFSPFSINRLAQGFRMRRSGPASVEGCLQDIAAVGCRAGRHVLFSSHCGPPRARIYGSPPSKNGG
jgi:hypothetical protein